MVIKGGAAFIFKDTVVNHSLFRFIQSNVNWKQVFAII